MTQIDEKGLLFSNPQLKTILIIGMANSVHTARWLSQFEGLNYNFILFPSTPSRSLHPDILRMTSGATGPKVSIPWHLDFLALPIALMDFFFFNTIRCYLLNRFLQRNQDVLVIHAVELQHAGYLSNGIKSRNLVGRKLIITNWGSDIYWFGRFKRHQKQLSNLLATATEYSCECERDVALAIDFGFKGKLHPVLPNAGGISDEILDRDSLVNPPSSRKLIVIKGYTRFVGLADVALEAISKCCDVIKEYEILVYSSDKKAIRLVRDLKRKTNLNISALPKYGVSHTEMLNLFSNARIYIGISRSDGISTSLLEAMATGCFPIQTKTSCADEWIEDGVGGLLVNYLRVEDISNAIIRAATENDLVDKAANINLQIARERLRQSDIRRQNNSFYE
jgi:glycosyltransferase involved in cell wall biosynthesis